MYFIVLSLECINLPFADWKPHSIEGLLPAMRLNLPAWFELLDETFSNKEVQLKNVLPACKNQ